MLLLLLVLFIPSIALGAGNETINPVPDSNKSSFRTESMSFWKNELPNIMHRYIKNDFVASGNNHGTAGGCTSGSVSFEGYTSSGNRVTASAVSINYCAPNIGGNISNDVCWVVGSPQEVPTLPASNFQRVGTTHIYVSCSGSSQPPWPADSVRLMRTTLDSGGITVVDDLRRPISLTLQGVYDVTDPLYGAIPDDETDIGPPLRAAIAAAISQRGRIVWIPDGMFKMSSGVIIPEGIDIRGNSWAADGSQTRGINTYPKRGTWIHINNNAFSPFTISGTGSRLSGIAFDYDQPTPFVGWTPTNYPYTIQINTESSWFSADIDIEDIFLNKSTHGINQSSISNMSSARINLRRIWGQVFNVGIRLEFVADVSRLSEIHFWPYWSVDQNIMNYHRDNTIGLHLLRTDSLMVRDFFILGAFAGFQIIDNPYGPTSGLQAANISLDVVKNGLIIDQQSMNGQISNLRIAGSWDGVSVSPGFENATAITVSKPFVRLDVSNFEGLSLGRQCVNVNNGPGVVQLSNVKCDNFNLGGSNAPGFNATSGGAIIFGGTQSLSSAHGAPLYGGTIFNAVFPGGASFGPDLSNPFFMQIIGGNPTIGFSPGNFMQYLTSFNLFSIGTGAGSYNTGGIVKPLCIQDGVLKVCP